VKAPKNPKKDKCKCRTPYASTTVKGTVKLSTDEEAIAGTNKCKVITPANLTARLQSPGPIGSVLPGPGSFTEFSVNAEDPVKISSSNNAFNAIELETTGSGSISINSSDGVNVVAEGGISLFAKQDAVFLTSDVNLPSALLLTATGVNSGIELKTGSSGVDINSDLALSGPGKKLGVKGGLSTDFIGQATLVAGSVTVANTNILANDRIFISRNNINGSTSLGVFDYSITPNTSFTIRSLNPADASVQTNDVSTVSYFIVRQL